MTHDHFKEIVAEIADRLQIDPIWDDDVTAIMGPVTCRFTQDAVTDVCDAETIVDTVVGELRRLGV